MSTACLRPTLFLTALLSAVAARAAAAPRAPDQDLHSAAANNDLSRAKEIVAAQPGVVDRGNAAGDTPLLIAARAGHDDMVAWLLAQGANPTARNGTDTPLKSAMIWPDMFDGPFLEAFSQLMAHSVTQVKLAGAPLTVDTLHATPPERPAMRALFRPMPPDILARRVRILEMLVEAGAKVSNTPATPEEVPDLHWATMVGFPARAIAALVRGGADPSGRAAHGITPLHLAAVVRNQEAAEALIAHRADREAIATLPMPKPGEVLAAGGLTPLMMAIGAGDPAMVKLLLDRGASVETSNHTTDRPIHFAAMAGDVDVLELLIGRGARIGARDQMMMTPLHVAATYGRLQAVRWLLDRGADIEASDNSGFTPLLDAVEKNHLEVVQLLAQRGASFGARNHFREAPLSVAAKANSLAVAGYLLERGENANGQPGETASPLLHAASTGATAMVTLLLQHGAEPDRRTINNWTPLQFTVLSRPKIFRQWNSARPPSGWGDTVQQTEVASEAVIRALVAAGAAIDSTDNAGNTALHQAAQFGDRGVVELLVSLGADREKRNGQNRTPAELAAQRGHSELARLLAGTEASPEPPRGPRVRERLSGLAANRAPDHTARATDAYTTGVVRSLVAGAKLKIERNDRDGALHDLNQALELDPQAADAYRERARLLALIDRKDAALADCTRALQLDPNRAENFLQRAILLTQKGNPREALPDLDRAIALDPRLPYAFGVRAVTRTRLGDHAGALSDVERALELRPDEPNMLTVRADLLRLKGEFQRASADFSAAIRINPGLADAYLGRGYSRHQLRDYSGAIADFDRALGLGSTSEAPAVVHYHRGLAHLAQADRKAAIADFTRTLELKPNHFDALVARADALRFQRQYDRAIADYSKAIELQPKRPHAYHGRGSSFASKGNHARAIGDFDRALVLQPKSGTALTGRGLSRSATDDFQAAMADYDTAIRFNPKFALAYFHRANTRNILGDFAAAVADYDQHLALHGAATYARLYRFLCLSRLSRDNEVSQLKATVARWNRAEWVTALGRFVVGEMTAEALVAAAKSGGGRPPARLCEAWYFIGAQELCAGNVAAAREAFARCLATKENAAVTFKFARSELARLDAMSTVSTEPERLSPAP